MPVTPLMQAVMNSEFRNATALLPISIFQSDGPSINTQDDDGNTLLHYIAKNKGIPQYLLRELSHYQAIINFSARNKQDKKPLTIALESKNDRAIEFILHYMPSPPITLNTLHYAAIRYPEYRGKLLDRICAPYKLNESEIRFLISLLTLYLEEPVGIMRAIMLGLPNFPYSFENEHPKLQFLYALSYLDENAALETLKRIHQHHPDVMNDSALMNGALDAARDGDRNIISAFLATVVNQQRSQALAVQAPPQPQNLPLTSIIEEGWSASLSQAYQEAGEYVDDMMNPTSATFLPARAREEVKRQKLEQEFDESFVKSLGENREKKYF